MVETDIKLNQLEWYMKYYIKMLGLKFNFEPDIEYEVHGYHVATSHEFKTFLRIKSYKYLWKDAYIYSFDEFINEDESFVRGYGRENYPFKSKLHECQIKFIN